MDEINKIIKNFLENHENYDQHLYWTKYLVMTGDLELDKYKEYYKNILKLIFCEGLFTFKQYNKAVKEVEKLKLVNYESEE